MPDHFAKEKADFLKKKDKSRKGSVDDGIKGIIGAINRKNDYYTTSSCSGRIVLLEMKSRKKNDCSWIFAKHDNAYFKEIADALEKAKNNYQIWLKQQPIILHVACRSIYAAKSLLDAARKIFKHSGIISVTDKKTTIEIIGSEHLETVIADGDFAIDEKYLKKLLKCANENFVENKKKSKIFLDAMKKF